TTNPLQPTNGGGYDAFVAKLNASGSALVYATYLGGSGDDVANGIAVDLAGNAYVTGWTYSANFPTANPFQADNGFISGTAFKSTNAGNTWSDTSTGLPGFSISALAVDPVTPSTLYAGTSDGTGGIYKSSNGGGSWSGSSTGLTAFGISALAVDPVTSSTVYAVTNGGIFKSVNGGG